MGTIRAEDAEVSRSKDVKTRRSEVINSETVNMSGKRGREKKWALVVFKPKNETMTLELSTFPKKNQKVGNVTSLLWTDKGSERKTKHECEILAIDTDSNKLNAMPVNSEGKLCDSSEKVFSQQVLDERTQLCQQQKILKSVRKCNVRQMDDKIKNDTGIFGATTSSQQKTMQSANVSRRSTMPCSSSFRSFSETCITTSQGSFDLHSSNTTTATVSQNQTGDNSSPLTPIAHDYLISLHDQPLDFSCQRRSNSSRTKPRVVDKTSGTSKVICVSDDNNMSLEKPLNKGQIGYSVPQDSTWHNEEHQEVSVPQQSTDGSDCMESIDTRDPLEFSDDNSVQKDIKDSANGIYEGDVKAFAGQLPFKGSISVTLQDIRHQEFLLAAMKAAYEADSKTNAENEEPYDVSNYYLTSGGNKKEIAPNCGFFLARNTISNIEDRASTTVGRYSWEVIVRETLLHVYGTSIKHYSALGSRKGRHPAINRALYRGLYDWACNRAEETIDLVAYNQSINKFCNNRRRYQRNKFVKDANGRKEAKDGRSPSPPTNRPHVQMQRIPSNQTLPFESSTPQPTDRTISLDSESYSEELPDWSKVFTPL